MSSIKTISEYIEEIKKQKEYKDSEVFYRGQPQYRDNKKEWSVSPSVFRKKYPDESDIYNFIMTECAHEIENGATHIDILCKMQHYQVPTRLLDITKNALAALFFACVNLDGSINKKYDGKVYLIKAKKDHIKVYDSDTVSILASIPRLRKTDRDKIKEISEKTRDEFCEHRKECLSLLFDLEPDCVKKFDSDEYSEVRRLLHEIKKEKPAFKDKINFCNILDSYIVIPQKKNARIIRQDGAFVLFGLGNEELKK